MSLPERVQNNPVLFVISIAIAGFVAGAGAYKTIVEVADGAQEPSASTVRMDQQLNAARELLDGMEMPVMLYSRDLVLLHANERMAAIYKMRKGDMVGKSPDMLNLIMKPHVENYRDFAAEQLDRIAKGHRGEHEGRAQVPMRLSAAYLNRPAASDWYFVSNPVYIGGERLTLTQLLEQPDECTEPTLAVRPQ